MKANRGAAGVDRETLDALEQYGVERMLDELQVVLHAGTYRPPPVLRRYIPKPDGRQRPLGIPTVRDRVAQMATTLVLEPIFEADFRASSYGFRPKRSATQALETLRVHGARGGNHVLDADIRDYFGSIDQSKLLKLVALRISDRRVLKLLRQWLTAGVIEEGQRRETLAARRRAGSSRRCCPTSTCTSSTGCGRTSVRSGHAGPLCRRLRGDVRHEGAGRGSPPTREHVLTRLGLELHPEKTRLVDLSRGREGFDFLGCHLRKRMSGPIWERSRQRVFYLQRWPSQRALRRVRQRVRELTPRRRCHEDLRLVIADLNPVLRGWGQYFRTGNAADHFTDVEPTWSAVCAACVSSAPTVALRRVSSCDGTAPSSKHWASAACAGRFSIREQRNAAIPRPPGKPCAGNPHARFERGSC